jgi:hypothetical protein
VVLVLTDRGLDIEDLADQLPGVSPGGLSAGLSNVPSAQTYLDISQGNRVFTSLYPEKAPRSFDTSAGPRVPGWKKLLDRAEGAPADVIPGLLGGELRAAGIPIHVDPSLRTPSVLAADRKGRIVRGPPGMCITAACPPGFDVIYANPPQLEQIAGNLELESGDDLMVVLERPPPPIRNLLTIGIVGRGFDGNLTSPTSRSPGMVVATDLAPTILDRFGLDAPEEMIGNPIEAEGPIDATAAAERAHRLSVITKRRNATIFDNALLWLVLALAAIGLTYGRAVKPALQLLTLSCVLLPLMLLVTAALEPTRGVERLIVGIGAPLLALAFWRGIGGISALAAACAVTVGAYALDVIAGSPFTSLSLIGSNPVIGVRFFGIGNELESTVAVLIPVGVGAALTAVRRGELSEGGGRTAAIAFLATGAVASLIFGLGRFGADVGAVLVLPVGAAVAAAVAIGATRNRRTLILILATPVLGLAALAALDLALGGGAHFTSSVLHSGGGSGSLGDVFDRRFTLMGRSFSRNADSVYLYAAVIVVILAIVKRRQIAGWFTGRRAAYAGLCGAAAATALGTVANDSGALLLMIGTAYLLAATAYFWAEDRV